MLLLRGEKYQLLKQLQVQDLNQPQKNKYFGCTIKVVGVECFIHPRKQKSF